MTGGPPRRSLAGALVICGVELAAGLFAGRPKVLPTDRPAIRVAAGEAHPKLLKCTHVPAAFRRRVTLISGALACGE